MQQAIAVTILSGFLGAGKTTLLQQILTQPHGHRIAVIENEFGAVAIDDQLLEQRATTIKTVSNGCICCSSANELAEALNELLDALDHGQVQFDRLMIESTGMADPGPITQTFFAHPRLCQRFQLDGIITLVDAVHAAKQLDQFAVAQAQVGYADRILLTKTDLQADYQDLLARLQRINARAEIIPVQHGQIDLEQLFNINGFMLNDQLQLAPRLRFIPQQADQVQSIVIEMPKPLPLAMISDTMEQLLLRYADQLLRYKGILAIEDHAERLLFQGVQRLYSADWDRPWRADETPHSTLVFIGMDLPHAEIEAAFAAYQ